jgi:hypothetical protein
VLAAIPCGGYSSGEALFIIIRGSEKKQKDVLPGEAD